MAVAVVLVVFVSVPLKLLAFDPDVPFVKEAGMPLVFQLKVVPFGILPLIVGLKVAPLQTTMVKLEILVATGNTVTVAEKDCPPQPAELVVML